MGWELKRGEMREEVCTTCVYGGWGGEVLADWVVQGEFGKGPFLEVWEGRRESARGRGTIPGQVLVRELLSVPGPKDRGWEWDGSPSMSSALGSSGEVGRQLRLTPSKGAGRLPQAHSVPPSHLLPGLPFGPAPWNPNANAPCPQGAHACQPPAPEGGARKGEWMGEHAGARLAVLGVAVVSHPGSHPREFCSGTALLYTGVSPASSCLGPRCSAQRGAGGR